MNLNEMYSSQYKTPPVTHADITTKVFWALAENERKVLAVYVDEGGIGWRAALATQDTLWEAYKGNTIDVLRATLTKLGYDAKNVLGGHHDSRRLLSVDPHGKLKNRR